MRRSRRATSWAFGALALGVAALLGCASEGGSSAIGALSPPAELRGEVRWTAIGDPSGLEGASDGVLVFSKRCSGCQNTWTVFALDATDGTPLWEREVHQNVNAQPRMDITVDDGHVSFLSGPRDGELGAHNVVVLSITDGAEVWSVPAPNTPSIYSRSASDGIESFAMSGPESLVAHRAFDRATGEPVSSFDTELHINRSARYDDFTVFDEVDLASGMPVEKRPRVVRARDAAGEILWERNDVPPPWLVEMSSWQGPDEAFVMSHETGLFAIDPSTGSTLWQADELFPADRSVRPTVIVDAERNGVLVCFASPPGVTVVLLDLATGTETLRTTVEAPTFLPRTSAPYRAGAIVTWTERTLVVAQAKHCLGSETERPGTTVTGYDSSNGEVRWSRTVGQSLRSAERYATSERTWPSVPNGHLLFTSETMTELVRPKSGTTLTEWPTDSQLVQIVDDVIVAQTGVDEQRQRFTGFGVAGEAPAVQFTAGLFFGIYDDAAVIGDSDGRIVVID